MTTSILLVVYTASSHCCTNYFQKRKKYIPKISINFEVFVSRLHLVSNVLLVVTVCTF